MSIESRRAGKVSPAGAILPAGSPLAQFEIQRYADGVVDENLPCVVWVDSSKHLKPGPIGIGCKCSGPFYPIRQMPGDVQIASEFPGFTPSVCACMGRFVE